MYQYLNIWTNITVAQASIVGSTITAFAAIVGVLIGSKLLEGRVKDLKGAIDKSDDLIVNHKHKVEETMSAVAQEISDLSELVRSISESLGKIGGSVGDLASATPPQGLSETQVDARQALREDWEAVRDRIEEIAASHGDGRTRARYARIDRRKYDDLIAALKTDGLLFSNSSKFNEALEIWNRYRNGRKTPSAEDLKRMSSLRGIIVN